MNTRDEQSVIDEATWRTWLAKGKARERVATVKYKWTGGICLGLMALAATFCFGAIR